MSQEVNNMKISSRAIGMQDLEVTMGYDLTCLTIPEPSQGDALAASQAECDATEAAGSYFYFNFVAWPAVLVLAIHHGWEPEHGAEQYTHNDWQVVSAADANNLAAALERAVESLARVPSLHPSHPVHRGARGLEEIKQVLDLSPEEFWVDNGDVLRRFIRFARQGAFGID